MTIMLRVTYMKPYVTKEVRLIRMMSIVSSNLITLAKDKKEDAKQLLMEIYMENSEFRDVDQLLREL